MIMFQMDVWNLKSALILLIKYYNIQNLCGILNEAPCIQLAQGAAKLLEVKIGGLKNSEIFSRSHNLLCLPTCFSFFSYLLYWLPSVLQPLEQHGCTIWGKLCKIFYCLYSGRGIKNGKRHLWFQIPYKVPAKCAENSFAIEVTYFTQGYSY